MNRIKTVLGFMSLLVIVGCVAAPENRIQVLHPDDVAVIKVAPGVALQELSGRTAPLAARSERTSVALFRLQPGSASAWSYNRTGEESFYVLRGSGVVWVGDQFHPVKAGSYVLVPRGVVRSMRASGDEELTFYAITSPAWRQGDDVLVAAPVTLVDKPEMSLSQ